MNGRAERGRVFSDGAGARLALTALVLGSAGWSAAQSPAAPAARSFEVVSIKTSGPNSGMMIQWKGTDLYKAQHQPLMTSLILAFFSTTGLLNRAASDRVVNAPPWVKNDLYDIVGKVMPEDVSAWQKQGPDLPLMQELVQKALEDRCKLQVHHAARNAPVYELVPGKRAPAIQVFDPKQPVPENAVGLPTSGKVVPILQKGGRTVTFMDISMAEFAARLASSSDRPVVDRTGLSGRYTFALSLRDATGKAASDPEGSTPYDLDTLGFKLAPATVPIDVVVIDHIEKPTPD